PDRDCKARTRRVRIKGRIGKGGSCCLDAWNVEPLKSTRSGSNPLSLVPKYLGVNSFLLAFRCPFSGCSGCNSVGIALRTISATNGLNIPFRGARSLPRPIGQSEESAVGLQRQLRS